MSVTSQRVTALWRGFGSSFCYEESEKTNHERWKVLEQVKKNDQSLGSKTLIRFSLVQAHSNACEKFFMILHIKNHLQNYSIVLWHEVKYGFLISTCRTLAIWVISYETRGDISWKGIKTWSKIKPGKKLVLWVSSLLSNANTLCHKLRARYALGYFNSLITTHGLWIGIVSGLNWIWIGHSPIWI